MSDNEFDTPEVYQREAALNEPEAPAPAVEDIADEPAAGDEPVAPVVPVVVPVAPAPVAKEFDRRQEIAGLREDQDNSIEGMALKTKEILSKQPKVRMMIPLDPGEKAGAYRTVIINGYRFDVRKNTMVDLPEAVAALLADAYRITSEVTEGSPLNLNNADGQKRSALGL